MATPLDLVDPPAVMSYGGLVDASTAQGQVDEEADWCGAVAALVTAKLARDSVDSRLRSQARPATRVAHITSRRGTYWQPAARSVAGREQPQAAR
jgi:hypothetical protein